MEGKRESPIDRDDKQSLQFPFPPFLPSCMTSSGTPKKIERMGREGKKPRGGRKCHQATRHPPLSQSECQNGRGGIPPDIPPIPPPIGPPPMPPIGPPPNGAPPEAPIAPGAPPKAPGDGPVATPGAGGINARCPPSPGRFGIPIMYSGLKSLGADFCFSSSSSLCVTFLSSASTRPVYSLRIWIMKGMHWSIHPFLHAISRAMSGLT
mmetsp:Transcript_35624/g.70204  ORF Transcript_35624/g.70204 Transcript_35624/m.70204 type:complete len:208 (-) Transcript_35624:3093-3716(-)